MEELENELPVVLEGQVPLGDLLSRVAQAIYAELSELAETLPNMSDGARKRTLADWVVKTKKQVVKLYAITKWARDAETVQKCMNITAFLMNQNQQFEDVMRGLTYAKESLDPARLRNHDLLTSLDVLTTGTYQRLPSGIKKSIVPITPLSDAEVVSTLSDIENAIRYRLRMTEIIPVEMLQHCIANGRVHFTVPKLFETAICLRGAEKHDGWFFVSVKFLITVGGDLTGMQEFPSEPSGVLRRHIADEADLRMACYLPLPDNPEFAPNPEDPPRPQLPEGTVDAPLVRLFNFLQMMSMSYQLEILCYQAQRMRSLGWADFLKVEMRDGRKTLSVSYWMRSPQPGVPAPPPNRLKLPPHGGTLTISIVEKVGKKAARSPIARMLAELQRKSKLGDMRPSDDVESLQFDAKWEPMKGVLAANIDAEEAIAAVKELVVESANIDFESMLRKVIEVHTQEILRFYQVQLQRGPVRVFSPEGKVVLGSERGYHSLRVHLCADEVAIVSIDARTGRLSIRDTGDLAAAGRGPRFSAISDKLNEAPNMLFDVLIRLRFNTITDIVEQKANYLGFQVFRHRNFSKEEIQKLGPAARGMMYIQLANFPTHYLVLVLTDEEFRYALISTKMLSDTMFGNMIMEDIGWLDVRRIRGDRGVGAGMDEVVITSLSHEPLVVQKRRRDDILPELSRSEDSFNLETQVLRELYAYCCARVAYTRVERQFKLRGIPYTHVNPTIILPQISELAHIQSSLARSVPALCVQSSDILSGAPAAEAAMPNIRVIPLNWWSDKKAQVVTCVKLKYVQQPVGKRAAAGSSGKNIIRPSKRIIYDAAEAVVSFLSEEVDTCVDEFLEEWARVSKMVVIAREVARMAKDKTWRDVRLLSFDLQTVEFAYASDYTVLITCTDQLSPTGGSFELRFSRCIPSPALLQPSSLAPPQFRFPTHQLRTNPHEEAEPYLRHVLRHGPLASSLDRLVELLRNTLPIAVELEHMRATSRDAKQSPGRGRGRPRIAVQAGASEPWVDTYVKGLGWWRVLYGDLRHALDFRLMTGQRVAILDASYSLFGSSSPTSSSSTSSSSSELLSLLPIPDFKTLVIDAIQYVRMKDEHARVACIDAGVVCDSSVLKGVARALHERVLKKLRDG
ncbi:mediator complex subunit MED14-domain-containing protein [Suillus clintonianus]|uniref:mediator complex subunit MED14-domain-containing protein n=1 Tax=Suillus clintonianus TaxID=1904413 RepID=UPI001B86468D|nr:mediator complex subunit MED14-domain-containing protein [Suillus clintonianus]KAG2126062.1 mediator complex subunit MED14-domain-containing protein [Suillus clintonianus]